ncbi:MAG: U32 family peptidase [Planctomycetes bacterium]|nr:U32 family peptidase [Planctomycetota bacterium]
MMRIVMPTSFEDALLERLESANERARGRAIQVAELYGSLPLSPTGCGRPRQSLPQVERAEFARHVAAARARGLGFNCLLNASCTGNREFDPSERGRFIDELHFARDAGCTALVLASPYLIDLAARHAPELRIHVSSVAFARSIGEAQHYQGRGAARLILDPDTIRDFAFIRRLRRECPDLELEALCNHPCLLHCPYETYCYNSVSHASAEDSPAPYEAFSLLNCNLDKLASPVEFVKGSWFRPEDVRYYEEAGVSAIKIAGRGRSSDWLASCAEAYLARAFDGDMMDLVWDAQLAAAWRAAGASGPPPRPVRVKAAALEGFVEHFARNDPGCARGCGACRFCEGVAARALAVDEGERARLQTALGRAAARLLERGDG